MRGAAAWLQVKSMKCAKLRSLLSSAPTPFQWHPFDLKWSKGKNEAVAVGGKRQGEERRRRGSSSPNSDGKLLFWRPPTQLCPRTEVSPPQQLSVLPEEQEQPGSEGGWLPLWHAGRCHWMSCLWNSHKVETNSFKPACLQWRNSRPFDVKSVRVNDWPSDSCNRTYMHACTFSGRILRLRT